MAVGGGADVLIKILMVLAGLMATGERKDGEAPPPLDVPAAVRAESVVYAGMDVRELRAAMAGRIDPTRDFGLPVEADLARALEDLETRFGLPADVLRTLAGRTTRVHFVLSTISERGSPRFAVVLEGELAEPVRTALQAVEARMRADDYEGGIFPVRVDGEEEILFVGHGRDAESLALAVRPRFVILATEINLVKDLLRGLAAVADGRPRPDALRPWLDAHGAPLPAAQAAAAAWASLNTRLLVQVAYLAEGGRAALHEVAIADLLLDLSAYGPEVMTWDRQGLRFRMAMDPRSEVLRLLQPSPDGARLLQAFGPKTTAGAVVALERPGDVYAFVTGRLRTIGQIRGGDGLLRDLDSFERELQEEAGLDPAALAAGIREVAVVTAGREQMGLLGTGCILLRFVDTETATGLFDNLTAALRQRMPELPVREEAGLRSIETFGMMRPGLVLRDDIAAIGMDKTACLEALLTARKTPAGDAALARQAAGRSIAIAADLDALLRGLAPEAVRADLPPDSPEDAAARRSVLSFDVGPEGLALTLDRSPAQVMEIARLAMPALARAFQNARAAAQRAQSMNNLRQILVGILMYTNDHEGLPPDLDALEAYIGDKDLLVSPMTGQRYVYLGKEGQQPTPDWILLHDAPQPDGAVLAGFGDAHVQVLTGDEFQARLDAQKAAQQEKQDDGKDAEDQAQDRTVF